MGPYEIVKRFRSGSNELKLPIDMALLHPIFHVSILKKCIEEVLVEILDRQVNKLRNKEVASVKVLKEASCGEYYLGGRGRHDVLIALSFFLSLLVKVRLVTSPSFYEWS